MNGFTFDAGALIAVDRDDRRVAAIIARVARNRWSITVLATALAQALRDPKRQANLSSLLNRPYVVVAPLSQQDASAVGILLASTGTKDIVDAHVALCASRNRQAIATSDPEDLTRLAPDVEIVIV